MSIHARIKQRRLAMKMSMEALAKLAGVSSWQTVQQWEREDGTAPKRGRLQAVAEALSVSPDWLLFGPEAQVRQQASNLEPGPTIRGRVPLISWVQAGDFCEAQDPLSVGDAENWLSCPVPHGANTFCLRVVGRSMDGDGGYRDGEIIFVDPAVEALPGRDVIVRTPDGQATFKRLRQDIDGLYLQALNPRWEPNYIKLPEGSTICGVVIFAGRET